MKKPDLELVPGIAAALAATLREPAVQDAAEQHYALEPLAALIRALEEGGTIRAKPLQGPGGEA